MADKIWIPYMWSKRWLAKDIIHYIRQQNPSAKYLYDIFGGGGSISFEALQQWFEKVYYVDLDEWMCNLLTQIKQWIPEDWNKRVSREEFHKIKKNKDAYSVAMSICWSFGNNRNDYLYWEDREEYKKATHYAVVNQDYSLLEKLWIYIKLEWKTIEERRLELKKVFWADGKYTIQHLKAIEHLERLQHLEIINKWYKKVEIETPLDETIVYCDPPYRWTAEYVVQTWRFNYKELDKRFRELPCPAYMSEENPHQVALSMAKRRLLSMVNPATVFEVLYTNWKILAPKREISREQPLF